jgi:hypothetical protein
LFLRWHNVRHRLTEASDSDGLLGGADTLENLKAGGFEFGNGYLIHDKPLAAIVDHGLTIVKCLR